MNDIRIALAGVGNIASAIVQGLAAKKHLDDSKISITPVVGFDINVNKVGLSLNKAIQVAPNCTKWLREDLSDFAGPVVRGPLLDKLSAPLSELIPVNEKSPNVDVSAVLHDFGVEVLVILLPTGLENTARHYTEAAFRAHCAVVNGMPAEIVNCKDVVSQSLSAGVPIIGDDFKSQVGATAIHRAIMELFTNRSASVERTLQLDWGGDTDFLNLVKGARYNSGKKRSKTESVVWNHPNTQTHISAADYVPFLNNSKEAYTRIEGTIFGGQKIRIEIHMEVEDAYNAAGVLLPATICAGIALRKGIAGPLDGPSAWFCKRPRKQMSDMDALLKYRDFLRQMELV